MMPITLWDLFVLLSGSKIIFLCFVGTMNETKSAYLLFLRQLNMTMRIITIKTIIPMTDPATTAALLVFLYTNVELL